MPNVAHMSHTANLAAVVRDLLGDNGLLNDDGTTKGRQAQRVIGIPRSTLDRLLVSGDFRTRELEQIEHAFGVPIEEMFRRARQRVPS